MAEIDHEHTQLEPSQERPQRAQASLTWRGIRLRDRNIDRIRDPLTSYRLQQQIQGERGLELDDHELIPASGRDIAAIHLRTHGESLRGEKIAHRGIQIGFPECGRTSLGGGLGHVGNATSTVSSPTHAARQKPTHPGQLPFRPYALPYSELVTRHSSLETPRMPSRFLPPDFDRSRPIGVIAGNGIYPILTVNAIRRTGAPVRLLAVEGDARAELIDSFPERERRVIDVGQIGKMLSSLREFGCGYAIMAGQVTPKRLFHGLKPDFKAAAILFKLKRKNAETIFGAIAEEIGAIGVTLLDARAFLDDHLADLGWMTKRLERIDDEYLNHGIEIAREVARLDIGQGVVVRKGTVIAVEAFEGTDEMLRRAGTFKTDQMLFVKTVKRAQDYRFDVPVFGRRTLESMREAKITTAALEAGNTIILEKPEVLKQAADWGIQILGFPAGGQPGS